MYLFHLSTCFEQPRAHHQEKQLYQHNLWYMSLLSDLHTKRSPTQNVIYQMLYWYNWFSWWWARGCSKHVENWNKYIEKNCAPSWLFTMHHNRMYGQIHFVFDHFFFSKNRTVYERMWDKNGRNGQTTGGIRTQRMRFVCWMTKATDRMCKTSCYCTATMVTRTRLNSTFKSRLLACFSDRLFWRTFWMLLSLLQTTGWLLKVSHDHFLSYTVQFVTQSQFYRSTLHNLRS